MDCLCCPGRLCEQTMLYQITKKLLICTGAEWLLEVATLTLHIKRSIETAVYYPAVTVTGWIRSGSRYQNKFSFFLLSVNKHMASTGRPVLFKAKRLLELTSPQGRQQLSFSANKASIYNNGWWPSAFVTLSFFSFRLSEFERRVAERQQGFLHVPLFC